MAGSAAATTSSQRHGLTSSIWSPASRSGYFSSGPWKRSSLARPCSSQISGGAKDGHSLERAVSFDFGYRDIEREETLVWQQSVSQMFLPK